MSRAGKILVGLFVLSLFVGCVAFMFIGRWEIQIWVPFGLSVAFLIGAILRDRRFYSEILAMKTTRHGMNLGTLVVLAMILLAGLNYIAHSNNKKWDVTEEKLNTLSEQAVKITQKIDSDLEVIGFYTDDPGDNHTKAQFKSLTKMFQEENSNVKVTTVNPMKRPDLVKELDVQTVGTIVMKYKGKKTSVTEASEEKFTNALVKLTRDKNKVIYYVTGHGEAEAEESQEGNAISFFVKSLKEASYELKPLNLSETPKVPEDADVVAVIGPKSAFFEPEIKALEDYAFAGGHLFLATNASDARANHNMSEVMSRFGIKMSNLNIFDLNGASGTPGLAVADTYSTTSDVTKDFRRRRTLFYLATPLEKLSGSKEGAEKGSDSGYQYDELVKTSSSTFAVKKLSGTIDPNQADARGPFTIGMTVTGKYQNKDGKTSDKEFSVVAFGDAMFLSNGIILNQMNRDLGMNVISYLAKDSELISIRPKQLKGTPVTATRTTLLTFVLGVLLPVPLSLFASAIFVWLRRRNA